MSKYFGKCFGPSTSAPKSSFWLRCRSFLLSKFASQLKLIQSVVWVRILGICVTNSVIRVLLSGFWVSEFYLFSGSWVSGSQSPMVPGSRVPGLRVMGLRVLERGESDKKLLNVSVFEEKGNIVETNTQRDFKFWNILKCGALTRWKWQSVNKKCNSSKMSKFIKIWL